jgi:hypothetical protein
MSPSMTGFVSSFAVGNAPLTQRSVFVCAAPSLSARVARPSRALRMAASEPEEESFSLTSGDTSSRDILAEMRASAAKDEGPRTMNTGVTRDMDGKSNVWAVEPSENVDEKPEINKVAILGAVFAAVAFALIVLPKLPFINGDQF